MWATARVLSRKKREKQIGTFLGGNFCVFGGQIKVVLHTCLPFRLFRINSVNVLNTRAGSGVTNAELSGRRCVLGCAGIPITNLIHLAFYSFIVHRMNISYLN